MLRVTKLSAWRYKRYVFVGFVLVLSWFSMMIVHESGHVIHSWFSGGVVKQVILYPTVFSQTEMKINPYPIFVAWGGMLWGTIIPLILLGIVRGFKISSWYIFQFFAGFCFVANGFYFIIGGIDSTGDPGDIIFYGISSILVIIAGIIEACIGFLLWHGLSKAFGIGVPGSRTNLNHFGCVFIVLIMILLIEIFMKGRFLFS